MVVSQDTWISSLPFFRWPTYISSEVDDHLYVCDLLNANGRGWRVQKITKLFDDPLANRILTTLVPIYCS